MYIPKISVITITYNSEKTIEETIKSIICQDYDNLEYLIIDGGSTDDTLKIVDKYRSKISFVLSEPDKGISDAFNKGIINATGEIIGIINSDDLLEKGALFTIAQAFDPIIDVYSGNVIYFGDNRKEKICIPDIMFDRLKLQYKVAHPGRFIRKSAYMKWGLYSVDLRYKMDIDLLVRFYKNGAKFYHVDAPVARFRRGGVTSNSIFNKKNDYYLFVTRNGWSEFQFKIIWVQAILKALVKRIILHYF